MAKNYLSKLRQLSFDQLTVRVSQKVKTVFERVGQSQLSRVPSDQVFFSLLTPDLTTATQSAAGCLDHFRNRTQPNFFRGMRDKEKTLTVLRKHWGNAEAEIVSNANKILKNRFDLLGFCDLNFGTEVDWHLEPLSNKRTPSIHWSRIDFLDTDLAGDKKIIWELNRHQYFITLGQAYWLTNDERYAKAFVNHLESWMDHNPPKFGINWASSLEVAFRSISWVWALHFFRDSPSLLPETFVRCLKCLYLNGCHIENYQSTYFSPNTHLTGEALGLFYLGILLPEFKDAKRWKDKGIEILTKELRRHIRPDGVYFEQSSYYHRYTADFYIHLLTLLHENIEEVPSVIVDALRSMLRHLMHLTRPDGTTPLFGDDDGGRLVKLDRRPANDFRGTLATGSVLLQQPDLKFVAQEASEETLWLLGAEGLDTFLSIGAAEPKEMSVAFPDGGYYVMRDSWLPTANYCLFDCGPHGSLSSGHSHADALAIEIAANGRNELVDPGTYTYTGSKEMRDWFRSSAAHNTLTVDGESSSVSDGPFSWASIARCETQAWIGEKRFDYVEGQHDGYRRLPQPAIHKRSIMFIRNGYWIIRDNVFSRGSHKLELSFHFAEALGLTKQPDKDELLGLRPNGSGISLTVFPPGGDWKTEDKWVSCCYGEREAARVGTYSVAAAGDKELMTFIIPYGEAPIERKSVVEVEASGGRAFHVTDAKGLDVVMIGSNEAKNNVKTVRLDSDAAWVWVRFEDADTGRVPREVVLLKGQTLIVDRKIVIDAERTEDYLTAHNVDGEWVIETGTPKSN